LQADAVLATACVSGDYDPNAGATLHQSTLVHIEPRLLLATDAKFSYRRMQTTAHVFAMEAQLLPLAQIMQAGTCANGRT
jgi:hypothetical protein